MNLLEIIEVLDEQDSHSTIWISSEYDWSANSNVIVALEPEDGSKPNSVGKKFEYFLEVFIAKEILEEFENKTPFEKTKRIIEYAVNDA
tara:strand:+ start:1413 stop:1679 length:267 start_codon:yes stop_codon:yes gene_type:complete